MSVVKWHGNFLEKYLKIVIIWNHFTAWRSTRTRLFRPKIDYYYTYVIMNRFFLIGDSQVVIILFTMFTLGLT